MKSQAREPNQRQIAGKKYERIDMWHPSRQLDTAASPGEARSAKTGPRGCCQVAHGLENLPAGTAGSSGVFSGSP
jgi:hypothetical protein